MKGDLMKEISFSELKNEMNKGLVLIEVFTPTCGVCAAVQRKLQKIEENYPEWKFYSINMLDNPEVSGEFTVFTVPTIIAFHNGKELNRWARNFGIHQITDYLDRLTKMLG
ncbi:co-chaperone YbbN [Kosmotoga sp. DU53]|nr:thioredoxin family protein [Kosmotoga sp. DU53]